MTTIKDLQNKILTNEKKELEVLRKKQNYKVSHVVSYVTLSMDFVALIVYYLIFRGKWESIPGYRYLFYIHLIYLISFVFYYGFLFLHMQKKKRLFRKIAYYFYVIMTLLWCIAMAVNAEIIHNHLYAFVIGIFSLAYFLIYQRKGIILLLLSSLVIFVVFSFLLNNNTAEVISYSINSFVCTILAYFMARLNYKAFLRDFINRKKLLIKNKQLAEQNKFKSIFLGDTSHELKTPINMIYSVEQMLDKYVHKEIEDSEIQGRISNYLKIIKQNSFRLLRLINNIVDVTRMDIGDYRINFRNIDVVKIIKQIFDSVKVYVKEKGINIDFYTELEEKVIACDPNAIERIMLNLISNAVKYTPVDGNINISIYQDEENQNKDKYIKISVKDNGAGIKKEIQDSIFERYVQADDSFTREGGGSGIGLSLVKKLVVKHDGSIELISAPGEGSEFIIELPDRRLDVDDNNEDDTYRINEKSIENTMLEFSDL